MTLNQNMLIILRFRIRWFTRNLCWHELPPKPIHTAFGSFGKGPHSVGFECNLTRAERGRRNGVVASAQKDLRKAEINPRALVLLLKNHAPSPNWFSAPKKTWCINLSIEVSNLFEQLDLPLIRTLQRNSGKHCKHKAKIHTDCTILQINYLPSSCGEPASTTCQTMWRGLSSFKIKIERASRNGPIDGTRAMNYLQYLLVSLIHHSNRSSQLQSHSDIKPTKWLPQSIETDAANGWCESVNQSAQ